MAPSTPLPNLALLQASSGAASRALVEPSPPLLRPRYYYGPPWDGPPPLGPGAIAAIVLCVGLFVLLVVWVCCLYSRRGARQRRRRGSASPHGRAYYTEYTQATTGVRGGGGAEDYEVEDFSGSSGESGITRVKRAKTRRNRHSRR